MAERRNAPPSPAADFAAAIKLARHLVGRLEIARDNSALGLDVTPQLRVIAGSFREVAELLEEAPRGGRRRLL